MIFQELKLKGACIIEIDKYKDERGFFARTWCEEEFKKQGLMSRIVQTNISYNYQKGTLRGMHYQIKPHEEAKIIRCIRGAIYDVIIDLRPESSTYREWISLELTADKFQMLYIPELFAHGFQTLVNDTEVYYQMSEFYAPSAGRGIRYNDPAFDVKWPCEVSLISDKDASWPNFIT